MTWYTQGDKHERSAERRRWSEDWRRMRKGMVGEAAMSMREKSDGLTIPPRMKFEAEDRKTGLGHNKKKNSEMFSLLI